MKTNIIQSDFDRLALLDADGWDHNRHYHSYLVRQIPLRCEYILEIGCGTGSFYRQLSQYAGGIVVLDLSPMMIEVARQRSSSYPNIEYQVADAGTWEFPMEKFDCIVSIATLHHLSLEHSIQKMKFALKANGVIVVLDLYEAEGFGDVMRNLIAVPVHTFLRLKNTGRLWEPEEVREAWTRHSEHDTYFRVSEVRHICQELLPGAVIKKHLLWRYSIVWGKPA